MWRALDPILWKLTQNPWVVLQTVSQDQLKRVLADPTVTSPIAEVVKELSAELARFKDAHPNWRPDVPDEIPGLESAREVFASTLRMQREPMDLKKQTERLTNYVSGTEGEIEALKPHTKLKTG